MSGRVGCPLSLTLTDADGNTATADSGDVLLQPAAKRFMTHEDVLAAVGQLGDNVLMPASVDVSGLALDQGGICFVRAGWSAQWLSDVARIDIAQLA